MEIRNQITRYFLIHNAEIETLRRLEIYFRVLAPRGSDLSPYIIDSGFWYRSRSQKVFFCDFFFQIKGRKIPKNKEMFRLRLQLM